MFQSFLAVKLGGLFLSFAFFIGWVGGVAMVYWHVFSMEKSWVFFLLC